MDVNISFKQEFGLIFIGAIIFVISFLWKDLITDIEGIYFPRKYGLLGRFFFIMLITLILIMVIVYIKKICKINRTPSNSNDDRSEPIVDSYWEPD